MNDGGIRHITVTHQRHEDEDMPPSYEREMGELSARVAAMESDIKDVKSDVRAIRETMSEARGGWKAVALISGVSGTLGAAAVKFLPFLFNVPR